MRCEGSKDFSLLTRRHFGEVKDAPELRGDLVEFLWRDFEITMRLLQFLTSFGLVSWSSRN